MIGAEDSGVDGLSQNVPVRIRIEAAGPGAENAPGSRPSISGLEDGGRCVEEALDRRAACWRCWNPLFPVSTTSRGPKSGSTASDPDFAGWGSSNIACRPHRRPPSFTRPPDSPAPQQVPRP